MHYFFVEKLQYIVANSLKINNFQKSQKQKDRKGTYKIYFRRKQMFVKILLPLIILSVCQKLNMQYKQAFMESI